MPNRIPSFFENGEDADPSADVSLAQEITPFLKTIVSCVSKSRP